MLETSRSQGPGRATTLALGIVAWAIVVRVAALAVLGMDPLQIHRVAAGAGLDWHWGYERPRWRSPSRAARASLPFPDETGLHGWRRSIRCCSAD